MRFDSLTRSMTSAQANQLEASNQASSGLRVNAPSDDPIAAAQAVRVRAAADRTKDYRAAISKVSGDANLAESALAQASDLLGSAHDLALQGASGALNASERSAIAVQVKSLREEILDLANSKGGLGYLFGGTITETPPFSPTGVYQGNGETRVIEVAAGVTSAISTNGQDAFAAVGGRDIFADLKSLEDNLVANDQTAVVQSVNDLDAGVRQIVAARVDAGIRASRLDAADSIHSQTQISLSGEERNLTEVDQAAAYTELARAQQGIEASFGVSKQMIDSLGQSRLI